MKSTNILQPKSKVSMTDLRRNPWEVIRIAQDFPVAVLNRNKLELYLLSAELFETLMDFIDEASLIEINKARRAGKAIKVMI